MRSGFAERKGHIVERWKMSEVIQVSLDNQGRIVIPPVFRERLRLSQGMTLVVENGEQGELCLRVQEEAPVLVDKQGVLVARVQATADLTNLTRKERDQRVSDLMQQVGS